MTDPRQIAGGIVGSVDWQNEVSGFCRCPGEALHTQQNGKKDCRVSVDGAPTIFCFHASCAPAVAEANRKLRCAIGQSPWEITLPGGRVLRSGDVLQRDGTVRTREVIQQGAWSREREEEKTRLTSLSEFTGTQWPAFVNHVSHISYRPIAVNVNNGKLMNNQEFQRRPRKELAGEAIGHSQRDSFDSRLGLIGLRQLTPEGMGVKGRRHFYRRWMRMGADFSSARRIVHSCQLGVHFGRPVAPNQFQRCWQVKASPKISASEARRGIVNGQVSNGVFVANAGELPPRELFDFGKTEPPTDRAVIEELRRKQFAAATKGAFVRLGHGRFLVARKVEVNGND